jgi:PAS domain S-box-containing protein
MGHKVKIWNRFSALRVISALVIVSGLVATVLLCTRLISKELAELRSTADAHARRIASQVQSGVLAATDPLERLGQWWLTQGRPADPEDWANDGQLFLSQSPGLRKAIWLDPDGRQRWWAAPGTVPDSAVTGLDLEALREIEAVQRGRERTISGVFTSVGSGPAIYVCYPVNYKGRVRGYVLGLYDVKALVSAIANGSTLQEQRVTIAAQGKPIYDSGPPQSGEAARAVIPLANQVWTLELNVPLHYFREFRGLIVAVIGIIGALIYSFIILLALSHRWSSALQRVNSALESEVELRTHAEEEVSALNRELSRKVADFETLLEVIPIGIAVADEPQCRSIRVNAALSKMLGLPQLAGAPMKAIEMAGLSHRIHRNGKDLLPSELPMHVAGVTGKNVHDEQEQIVRSDGTVLDVLSFAAPVFDENLQVRGVLNAWVDISERKRLEQRLHRAERMKSLGAMAAGIAHDFNNLLTSILGNGCLAAECVPKQSEALQHIAASMDSAQQASALVQKVLAYTGHSSHTLRPMNLGEAVRIMKPWLGTLAAPGPAILLDIAPGLPNILADGGEVRQVIRNLVLNAAEATLRKAGDIEIRVDCCELSGTEPHLILPDENFKPGRYVWLEVTDHGSGMPPEIAERAFDPFFSTKFLGRGLGLSEVLGIMRAHSGAVRLSTAPIRGTTVQLFFPVGELSAESAMSVDQSHVAL